MHWKSRSKPWKVCLSINIYAAASPIEQHTIEIIKLLAWLTQNAINTHCKNNIVSQGKACYMNTKSMMYKSISLCYIQFQMKMGLKHERNYWASTVWLSQLQRDNSICDKKMTWNLLQCKRTVRIVQVN